MQQTEGRTRPTLKDLPPEFTGLKVGVVVKGTGMCQSCQMTVAPAK